MGSFSRGDEGRPGGAQAKGITRSTGSVFQREQPECRRQLEAFPHSPLPHIKTHWGTISYREAWGGCCGGHSLGGNRVCTACLALLFTGAEQKKRRHGKSVPPLVNRCKSSFFSGDDFERRLTTRQAQAGQLCLLPELSPVQYARHRYRRHHQ